MVKDLNELARKILEENQYMTIGSYGGMPWVLPVVYAYDDKWNFYFVSIPDSRHCMNFKENNKIAFAIFDSRQNLGEGVGLQIEGAVSGVSLLDTPKAAEIYFRRKYPCGAMHHAFNITLRRFIEKKLYRFYKITPTKLWMNDPNSDIDVRVELKLENLIAR